MASISEKMRQAWSSYACERSKMTRISFGPDSILVAPETVDAWKALEKVLLAYGYQIRVEDTDSYNCREIKPGGAKSLHSYGIALDINWNTNPYRDHAGRKKPRFSDKATQLERGRDVKLGKADTDMARSMVDAALAISTEGGKGVFGWGGNWETIKDAMHFQIEVTPEELGEGIDWNTVDGRSTVPDSDNDGQHVPPPPQTNEEAGLPKIFFDTVRAGVFSGSLTQNAVNSMTTIVKFWIENHSGAPHNQLAYILATVLAEVGRNMTPVRETFASTDAIARKKLAHKKYGKPKPPYNHVYYGRGYVQLTHDYNYKTQSDKLGIDLVKHPDEALKPAIAIQILVNGMMDGDFNRYGHGLPYYVNETKQDFVKARYTVNVQDRADEIAGYAKTFLNALQKADAEKGPSLGLERHHNIIAQQTMRQTVIEHLSNARDYSEATSHGRSNPNLSNILAGLEPAQYRMVLDGMGLEQNSIAKFEEVLGALERAGIVKPASGLTPVNAALGDTVGKLLDGKKTGLGVVALLVSIFLPQFSPLLSLITTVDPADIQDKMTPIATLLAAWGGFGKIDKWMHKPSLNSIGEILTRLGK